MLTFENVCFPAYAENEKAAKNRKYEPKAGKCVHLGYAYKSTASIIVQITETKNLLTKGMLFLMGIHFQF